MTADAVRPSARRRDAAATREQGFDQQLAACLRGPDREVRAELLAAAVVGIAVLRGKIVTEALATADVEVIGTYVDRIAAVLLDP